MLNAVLCFLGNLLASELLQQLVDKSEHHVSNSLQIVQTLEFIHIQPDDLMVSFDVVSLFTRVPIADSLKLLSHHFEDGVLALFKHVLTSTYFCFDEKFYEQMDVVAMGSPLSPVITNFFIEDFEKRATEQVPHKPMCWFRCTDDTFIIWPHGKQKLGEFLNHLNGIHKNIQFAMEIEGGGHLPFLDTDIYRNPDGSLGHKVYRKPTSTNQYLHQNSHHQPANKKSVLLSLIQRAKCLCDQNWFSSPLFSKKMDIAPSRFDEQWNPHHGP